jgi:hypothetical protein
MEYAMTTSTLMFQRALSGLMLMALSAGLPGLASAEQAGYAAPSAQASAASPDQPNDGSDYIAAWSVMGEICYDKYPQMKPAIDEFWTTRWNKETRERVAKMKQSADFKAKVLKHRKNLNARKDEILVQCGKLFMGGAH